MNLVRSEDTRSTTKIYGTFAQKELTNEDINIQDIVYEKIFNIVCHLKIPD